MKRALFTILLSLATLHAGEIKIAVAANVSYAMEPLKQAFNALHPDTKIEVILGSSGKLTAQIKNGAPYTLFMSANMKYPETLYDENLTVTEPVVYAQGVLAYLSVKPQEFSNLQTQRLSQGRSLCAHKVNGFTYCIRTGIFHEDVNPGFSFLKKF